MEKLKTYLNKIGIQCNIIRIPFRTDVTDWQPDAKHFAITLSRTGKKDIHGYYSQGSGIKSIPTVADFVFALATDAQGIEGTSFDMWCGDFGYDTDSRKALTTYEACLKEYKQLKSLFSSVELRKLYKLSADC